MGLGGTFRKTCHMAFNARHLVVPISTLNRLLLASPADGAQSPRTHGAPVAVWRAGWQQHAQTTGFPNCPEQLVRCLTGTLGE